MNANQLVDVIKTLKKTEVVFDDGSILRVGKSDIEIEDVPDSGGDQLILINPQIGEKQFRVLFSSATLNKQGQVTATALVDFWESNNFFFDIGSQVIADGRVEFRADLPITISFPAVGAIFFVEKPTLILGLWKQYPSGSYIKDTDTGSLTDWRKTNDKNRFTTNEFRVFDATDQSKQFQHDLTAVSTSSIITAIWRNLTGTVSFLIEKFRDYTVGGANPAHQEGRVFYDFGKKALSYYNEVSDVTINIAQEMVTRVCNDTGSTIEDGSAVRYGGAAILGIPTIVKSIATTTENARVAGVVTHDILDGEVGYLTVFGQVGGIDTSACNPGGILVLSASTAGVLTETEQPITTIVAICVLSDPTDGIILVRPEPVNDPFAIGQSFLSGSHTQALTTTPVPLEGYTDSPFTENMIITATASGGSFRAIIKPLSISFTGFYEITSLLTMLSSSNVVVVTELYINGVATGLVGIKDFSSNLVDEGTALLHAFTQSQLSETDDIEIFVYTRSGTTTITIDNVLFNAKRLGSV